MENKKDIGKAFREKLDRLDRTAPQSGWKAISGELRQMKKPPKFRWLRIAAISSLVMIVAAVATYPLWEEHVPHIYMRMPKEYNDRAKEGAETKNPVVTDNNTDSISAATHHDATLNDPAAVVGKDITVRSSGAKTAGAQPPATTFKRIDSPRPASESNLLPLKGNKAEAITPAGNTSETAPKLPLVQPPTLNESEGQFRMLDLSGVSYGSDSLKIKKEKKLDTKRIADSLNKLYGREKSERKKKKQR